MFEIARKPYIKLYKFPLISDASIFQLIIYILVILLPFFMVFSVRNFYLSHDDIIDIHPSILYNYTYYIQIQTSQKVQVFTNFFQQSSRNRGITLQYQYQQKQKYHDFMFQLPKVVEEKVKRITVVFGYTFSTNDVTDAFGLVSAGAQGTNLADVGIIGTLNIIPGGDQNISPTTSNILPDYQYNLAETLLALQNNYATFLDTKSESLSTNLPSNILKLNLRFKERLYHLDYTDASILGQLVWSFSQYFPIAFIFWLIARFVMRIILRQNIMGANIIHEKFIKR